VNLPASSGVGIYDQVHRCHTPGNPELAVGAVADGVQAIDEPAVRRLGLDMAEVRAEAARQTAEVARRAAVYRQGCPLLELAGRTAVLVDDGVATGWTCAAAASSSPSRTAPRRSRTTSSGCSPAAGSSPPRTATLSRSTGRRAGGPTSVRQREGCNAPVGQLQ
jgi:hypothetical protein